MDVFLTDTLYFICRDKHIGMTDIVYMRLLEVGYSGRNSGFSYGLFSVGFMVIRK